MNKERNMDDLRRSTDHDANDFPVVVLYLRHRDLQTPDLMELV